MSKIEVQWNKSSFIYIQISTNDNYQQYTNFKGLGEILDKIESFMLVLVCYGDTGRGVWNWGVEWGLEKLPQNSGEKEPQED